MRTIFKIILILIILAISLTSLFSQQLAFPDAEGFGRFATGGRGGSVYHVTNLNDAGAGSFRDAVSAQNRTVVFDIAGIINLASRVVVSSNITIAGQTAPGDGIVIYGDGISTSGASNVIIRYLRVRMGKNGTSGKDAIGIANGANQIFDHCSVTWGLDETFSISWDGKGTEPANVTISNCIIGQGLQTHSCGGLIQTDGGVSIVKCLYIDNKTRNPKVKGVNQFVNNVIYNWGGGGAYIEGDSEGASYANIEDNYFVSGPSTGTAPFTRGNANFHVFGNNNYHDSNKDGVLNGSLIPYTIEAYATADLQPTAYAYPTISRITINDLVDHIKNNVGAVLPNRDQVDTLIIGELSSLGKRGALYTNETDLLTGGPGLVFNAAPKADTDLDGMPNDWEVSNLLNPNDASDRNGDGDADGFTNLEEYLNSIATPEYYLKNPVNLAATAASDMQVNLTWKQYSPDEDGFAIEQSVNNTIFTQLATVGANVTSYNVTGLTKNTTYYFRVRAYNGGFTSVYSNTASAKTLSNIPINPSPANGVKYILPGKVIFTWSGAGTFKFYLGTDPNALEWKADLTAATYTITGLTENTTYYWRVDAVTTETLTGDVWNFNTRKQFPLGMVAHWKLNETIGESASDSSGYHNDGTLVDLDNSKWEPGISGNCLNFIGATEMSSLEVSHSDALYFDYNPFSIAFWMKAPSTQTECYFIHKGTFAKNATTGATGKWYGLQYKASTMYFAIDDDVTKSTLSTSSATFLTDTWVHVVAVRDTSAKMLYLYRNGTLVKSQADATKTSIGQEHVLHLGNCSDYTTPVTGYVPFKGSMDDMRMYNYALTATDISNLYNSSIPVPGASVNPTPADGFTYANVNMPKIAWSAGSAANTFDVYFGSNPGNLSLVSTNQAITTYKIPQILPNNTTYYWRVDSRNSKGTTTGTVWSFTTKKYFAEGMVGQWKLDETSGLLVADSSGYFNHGTIAKASGSPNAVFGLGKFGNSLVFSDSSYVSVPFADPLYFDNNSFSISLWMKWVSPPATSAYLIHKGSFVKDQAKDNNGKWYGIEIKGTGLNFSVDDDVTKTVLSTTSAEFCTGSWVHVVAVRDTVAKQLRLYRNNALVTSVTDNTGSVENLKKAYIANCNDINAPFTGSLDEVNLFNYALNTNQITNLYNSGAITFSHEIENIQGFGFDCNPNPVHNEAVFTIRVPKSGVVTLQVTDVTGNVVYKVFRGSIPQGETQFLWKPQIGNRKPETGNIHGGLYFATLKTSTGSITKKIVIVK